MFGEIMSKNYDFTCRILEVRRNWRGADIEHINRAYVTIHDESLELKKTGLVIPSDLGTVVFYFKDISSINYDKPGFLHTTSNIDIIMYSGEKIVLQKVKEVDYKKLHIKWTKFKNKPKSENIDNNFLKYAELYKEGLITEDEFATIKQKMIGAPNNNSTNYCKNCGAEISEDSLFCSNCGNKIE